MIILNGQKLDFETFPNGETKVDGDQINLNLDGLITNQVVLKYENDSDLIKLMLVKKHLDERLLSCDLTIAYMPYSRMDRVEGNSVFTLKYVSDFINYLMFEKVIVFDPHSDVTCALLDRSIAINHTTALLHNAIEEVKFNITYDYLFFPDGSALKRYGKIEGFKQLAGYKQRDFATGRINKLDIIGADRIDGAKVIIVDDLSSYGGTFLLSAEKLKELGASEIYLVVAHCEESIYNGNMFKTDLIDKVFTTNTIISEELNDRIKIFQVI
jgi:ribose-phosphate pyrophosphokinase